ncbi:reactive oxygen species modulator 1-like [Portunus trituberculatus]|uniref:reactive oxygen species modulator 1-like n=1 Tax=Portunus trituberculatus TaxID=210409 RepID=UPI001E1CEC77|nr:reactive oxygen species modulator 1-like [Portunus trituberculatus]
MPAMPAGSIYQQGQGPSCWDRVKLGFMMGFSVGMATGALFGGFTALRYGLRGRELLNNVGKVMLQSGGTFGTFMSIGAGIRC